MPAPTSFSSRHPRRRRRSNHTHCHVEARRTTLRPVAKRVPFLGGEKESLHVALDRHRDAVLWKLEGLSDEDLRRPMTPSGTNLLGLVKHLAAVEYGWFSTTFRRPIESLPFDDNDEDADLRVREETARHAGHVDILR